MMNPFRWRSIATARSLCCLSGILATIAGTAALTVLFGVVFAGHLLIWPIERLQRGCMILIGWILAAPR